MPKTLLVVHYGTTLPAAREDLAALESALAGAVPGLKIRRAVSSPAVRHAIAERGGKVLAPAQALELLLAEGVTDLAVLPTHLVPGSDFAALRAAVRAFRDGFARLRLGTPLLAEAEAVQALARHIAARWLPEQGALLLAGHGADGPAGACYTALAHALREAGAARALVGTLAGRPDFDAVLSALESGGWTRMTLRPLLLTAGVHACRELAGPGPDSWQNRLLARGIAAESCLTGMARDPGVQALYLRQLDRLLA